jgi:hypothetical protein
MQWGFFAYHQVASQFSFIIVYVADAHAQVQRFVSVVKMATVLEEYTTEEQRPVVRSLWATGLNEKDIHKEMCRAYSGKLLSRKAVHGWVEKFFKKEVRKSQIMPDRVRKWLRQESKDFYAAVFDALVKRWDKCWWRICREINIFPGSNIILFMFY